jgi:LysM repeat protein
MKHILYLILLTLIIVVFALYTPVDANSSAQVYYQTPTPGADGRIQYVVQAGDSCLSISLITGVDINTLRQLNNLNEECLLQDGQMLLLAIVEEPVETPGPPPTETPSIPSPTPLAGSGTICVLLFEDVNGNSVIEIDEGPLEGGAVSVSDRTGLVSLSGNTTNLRDPDTTDPIPLCFDEIPEGDYNVSVAPPDGYNPTTNMNYQLQLSAGDTLVLDFGAQPGSGLEPTNLAEGGRSPLLAIIGAILILGGAGLGVYFALFNRNK